MKTFVTFFFLMLMAMAGNAQKTKFKIDENNKELQLLREQAKKRTERQKEQLSPYSIKSKGKVLNPMLPACRNVSKYKTIDHGTVRILYAFNAEDIADPQTYDDLQRLEIGKNYVKYYGYNVFQADSIATVEFMISSKIYGVSFPMEGGNIFISMQIDGKHQGWSRNLFSEFFKDLSKNEMTEYCRMPSGRMLRKYKSYYTESVPVQDWQIEEETREIAGYLCQKAVCDFRGRSYTAWFTVDIPISQGPWKFSGLPGLILKVYDDRQEYVFECVGIEQHSQEYPIILLDNYKDYQKTTRLKLDKLLKSVCENYYQLTGMTDAVSTLLYPYNPIELK